MTPNLRYAVAAESMETRHIRTEPEALQAHRDELYRFILKRVRDEAVAEDLVQDVLVRMYTRQGTLKEPSKLRPWLYQVTRNAIVDYYRSRRRLETLPDDLVSETTVEEDRTAQRELARCLIPLLDVIPDPYGEALRLAEFERVSQAEVASRLGLSLPGAKSRVQRGRKMLRDVLLKCCRVELDRRGRIVDYEAHEGCVVCPSPRIT